MSTYAQLRRLFADLTMATLAAQAAGCSDSHGVPRGGFEETPCDLGNTLESAALSTEADYLALRRVPIFSDGQVDPDMVPTTEYAVGVPCAGATDAPACEEAFGALPTTPGFPSPDGFFTGIFSHHQLLWTRAGETGVITDAAELLAFLGTIDSAEEAALVARFAGNGSVVCDGPNTRVVDEGVQVITTSGTACGEGTSRSEHLLLIAPDGTVTVLRSVVVELGDPNCVIGRLTTGVAGPEATRHTDLGSYFREMARLEAVAVVAFERLARELEALGAPADLVTRARAAAADETRHTRAVAALAAAYGASAPTVASDVELPLRGAYEIALENAMEGCVRETYGALVATHQSLCAADPLIRATLGGIAADETQHAAFSWDLAAWLEGVLSAPERQRVRARRAQALQLFREPYDQGLGATARDLAGLPSSAVSEALFAGLERTLWTQVQC